jgi:hypothetical protein
MRVARTPEGDSAESVEHFPAERTLVHIEKVRQNKDGEPLSDSIGSDSALALDEELDCRAGFPVQSSSGGLRRLFCLSRSDMTKSILSMSWDRFDPNSSRSIAGPNRTVVGVSRNAFARPPSAARAERPWRSRPG